MTSQRSSVLWCDDDDMIRTAAAAVMRDTGIEVDFVASAADAQIALARKHHRVLVADLRMPVMDGLDLCRWARVWSPTARRILCTAYPDEYLRASDVVGLVDALVLKPFDATAMRGAIMEQMAYHKRSDPTFPVTVCNDAELVKAREEAAGAVREMQLSVAPGRDEPPR